MTIKAVLTLNGTLRLSSVALTCTLGLVLAILSFSVNAANASEAGYMRPDFTLQDLHGRDHAISEWDGKVLLINFWATWCAPCRKEIPELKALQDKYHEQGFEVIGVAADEAEEVIAYAKNAAFNYPVLQGEMMSVFDISEEYGNRSGVLPHSVFIDRKGQVRHIKNAVLSFDEADSIIHQLLTEDSAP